MSCIIELDENLSPLNHFPVNSEIEYLKTNNRLRILSYCHSFEPSSTGSRKVKKRLHSKVEETDDKQLVTQCDKY